MDIKRVLIANRGEIAVRVIKACHQLNLEAVAAVSEPDRESLAARLADRVVCIGPARASESYLNIPALVTAALGTGADAIHPGYGFLAENAGFANACESNGLKFIGPSAECIRKMGNKLEARALAQQYGVPLAKGSQDMGTLEDVAGAANEVGYPVLLKAAAGGGGRGIRVVRSGHELRSAFESASAEALSAFGDKTLYLERFIENARHIEIQVLGDRTGRVVHLGERDCSPQRRYQKMIESSPASDIDGELRRQMQTAAVTLAQNIGYENAGTVEFVVDQDRQQFYFMEMNTRIQVEHPVTEMITGIDLVSWQIRIAAGEEIDFSQEHVNPVGCALECRINAESPRHGFRPAPGRIERWQPPQGAGIRVDTHCYEGYFVPPFYDSLLAKLIVHARDRAGAIDRMLGALDDFLVCGIDTTISFLRFAISRPEFRSGPVNTRWLEECGQLFARTPGER
ncbi:MAG: acetyl-CoA carboxylase biotin carboxylase subunit [Betaproteobacteria bacterium]|nr:acetyl-CoA carboxylase biotin carboxylase subunit [Betaproteobacteria bacterium]